ncbi:uncharacterized protein LOC116256101 [Nymphaea colorata]|nr:uncharacterized protein LOC116256101 [Nymphaea colorata]
MEPSPKGVPESFESVRSKLRESLAAALSLVSQNSGKLRTNIDNSENQDIPHKVPLSEDVNPTSAALPLDNLASERPTEVPTGELRDLDQKLGEGKSLIQGSWNNELPNGSVKISHIDGQEFRMVPISSNGTVSSSRNEIESGHLVASCPNGDSDTAESEVHRESKRPKLEHDSNVGSIPEFANNCPQTLAVNIETELFKLFGGVNKKYKERARSLLFNLKDRNNPELRERVMSGEIAPNRLCTMTAEDLASKELSQWRIAKAEELAQMVVLPDSDVDIRRLVKKTHKGEFQVEVERDDNISVEVGIGGTLLSKAPPKASNTGKAEISKSDNPEKPDGALGAEKTDSKDEPSNGSTKKSSDFIEFTVEELRDNEFLPPIVSLDEFVGSLESEPFENLSLHSEERVSSPNGNNLDNLGSRSSESNSLKNLANSLDNPDNDGTKLMEVDTLGPADKSKLLSAQQVAGGSHGEQVWEGVVQLNISATADISAYLKGGEKTATEDWPSFLEIKGRVRVDAFEKFLQELRHSRSRAIMVSLFCWKEGSSEDGLLRLREVSESYIEDERVGFAEPAPAVELYLCPLHGKMMEMLGRHMPADYLDPLKDIVEGLIGIIIWRKTHVTTISPKSSSHNHHRPGSKKHSSSRRQDRDIHHPTHVGNAIPSGPLPSAAPADDDDIDDIPPGFGPASAAAAGRDVDDLPEFDFTRGSKPLAGPRSVAPAIARATPPRPLGIPLPAEQMRELVYKYGQGQGGGPGSNFRVAPVSVSSQPMSGFGPEVQPWNDDDDIPEWRPQVDCGPQANKRQLMQGYQQQRQQPLLPPTLPSAMRPPPLAPLPLAMPPSRSMPSQMAGTVLSPGSPWQVGQAWAHPYAYQGSPHTMVPPNGSATPPCHFSNVSPAGNTIYARPNFSAGQNGVDWRQ